MNNILGVGIFKKGRLILHILRSSMKKEKIDRSLEVIGRRYEGKRSSKLINIASF